MQLLHIFFGRLPISGECSGAGDQVFNDTRVQQSGCVAKILMVAGSDLPQHPPHDFSGSGFGQALRELNAIWAGDAPNFAVHVFTNTPFQIQ